MENSNMINSTIYDEMDDFCSEIFDGEGLLKYISAKKDFFINPKETLENLFDGSEIEKDKINTYGDFYYYYLTKYSNCYTYKFNSKGYTKSFVKLIKSNNINPNELNINWKDMEKKEKYYQEGLVDILYAMISYELKKIGYEIFGVNLGYETVIYYVVEEKKFERISNNQKMFKIFDISFLESIYNEIFEITGELGVDRVKIGDFLEKKSDGYYTLFIKDNIVINNINEENENEVKIIL